MLQTTALKVMQTGAHVFLTGEPGSGKTYVVNQYVAWLREHGIEPAITASTGIAATHVSGMTIHAWCGIGVKRSLTAYDVDAILTRERVYKRIAHTRVLIIDEISMLSSDTLTMVDTVCKAVKQRDIPFGGIQIVLVGDFFQLPPIVRRSYEADDGVDITYDDEPSIPFAFKSPSWESLNPIVCYLHEQYRQTDTELFDVLRLLRRGGMSESVLAVLQSRMCVDTSSLDVPHLYTHNDSVDTLNAKRLSKIDSQAETFLMTARGSDALTTALKKGCLSPEVLTLKVGARVMFTKNDPEDSYVNGTVGEVTGFNVHGFPEVLLHSGKTIVATPVEWNMNDGGKILARITQIPLRLAWAVTIHKSQGMTLSGAVVDLSRAFEYGQGYVALSRVSSLSHLYILGVNEQALQVHDDMYTQDILFKRNSAEARAVFEAMDESEHKNLVNAFVTAAGGVPKGGVAPKKQKKHTRKDSGKKVRTKDETLHLVREGKDIAGIASERKLTVGTICSHIFDLYMHGELENTDIMKLLPKHVVQALPEIGAFYKTLEEKKLQLVFDHFNGQYTYDDLRLATLILG